MTAIGQEASPISIGELREEWARLNDRYFGGTLPAIPIEWSRRLTASAGMFLSRIGPRARLDEISPLPEPRRLIRLSLPLLQNEPYQELAGTLAHEMIHQWQYDILKRRPNHGAEFREMMAVMNRDGLRITIRHNLDGPMQALARYAWQCQKCGRDYHRQRRTIQPRYHRCGDCHGRLKELPLPRVNGPTPPSQDAADGSPCFTGAHPVAPTQLDLPFEREVYDTRPPWARLSPSHFARPPQPTISPATPHARQDGRHAQGRAHTQGRGLFPWPERAETCSLFSHPPSPEPAETGSFPGTRRLPEHGP